MKGKLFNFVINYALCFSPTARLIIMAFSKPDSYNIKNYIKAYCLLSN